MASIRWFSALQTKIITSHSTPTKLNTDLQNMNGRPRYEETTAYHEFSSWDCVKIGPRKMAVALKLCMDQLRTCW